MLIVPVICSRRSCKVLYIRFTTHEDRIPRGYPFIYFIEYIIIHRSVVRSSQIKEKKTHAKQDRRWHRKIKNIRIIRNTTSSPCRMVRYIHGKYILSVVGRNTDLERQARLSYVDFIRHLFQPVTSREYFSLFFPFPRRLSFIFKILIHIYIYI